jgi:hypothetical protein
MFGSAKVGCKVKQFDRNTPTKPCKPIKGVQFQRLKNIKRSEMD